MTFSELSSDLKVILKSLLDIDEANNLIPVFTSEVIEQIFWKLIDYGESAKSLADELSAYISSLNRPEDKTLVTAVIQRPSARILEGDITIAALLDNVEVSFLKTLSEENISDDKALGRLLFSAARYGGLINAMNLEQLFHKLRDGLPPEVLNDTIWYDFKAKSGDSVTWLPDPLTMVFITEWLEKKRYKPFANKKRRGWFHYIKLLAQDSLHEDNSLSLSSALFLRACEVRLSMEIAPALVDIASGKTLTAPFNKTSWLRLLTEKAPKLNRTALPSKTRRKTTDPISPTLATSFDEEVAKRIRRICNNSERLSKHQCVEAVEQELISFETRLSTIHKLLIEWLTFRALNDGSWSGPLKLSSASNRLTLLRKTLLSRKQSNDILMLPDDEVTQLYEELLNANKKNEGRLNTIAKALRDFHDFLVRNYDLSPNFTPDKYILRSSRKGKTGSVDANVVMPWEYLHIKSFLTTPSKSEREFEIKRLALVAVIIGYRAGLRRSELNFLRVSDFSVDLRYPHLSEITVNESYALSLKSPAGYRRIKIGTLLTKPELNAVLTLVSERERTDGPLSFVFRTSRCKRPYIDPKNLFEPITHLLRQVTGDSSLRFHHLRHSVATWNFWRWMSPRAGKASATSSLSRVINFEKVASERQAILGVQDGLSGSRKTLHALSMMIGHSHPSITLRHYIHSSHITLHDQLCLIQPKLKKVKLAAIAGITPRGLSKTALKQAKKMGQIEVNEYKASSLRHRCIAKVKVMQDATNETLGWRKNNALSFPWHYTEPTGERLELVDYYLAAVDYFQYDMTMRTLENKYSVFGSSLSDVISRANKLLEMEVDVRKGNSYIKRPRHCLRTNVESVNESTGEVVPEVCYVKQLPNLPRQIRERITVEKMLIAVNKLNNTQKARLIKSLDYFVNHSTRDSSVSFRTRRPMDAFVSAIRLLELEVEGKNGKPAERLRLTINANGLKKSPIQQEKLKQYWNKTIGFSRYQIDYRNRNFGANYHYGQASVDLMSIEASTSKSKSRKRRVSDAGFRVGLYILYVTQPMWGRQ